MGQRLVVTVVKDTEEIAKIYYHWSAYSVSALYETRGVLDCLLDDNEIKDLRLRLIRFVESQGGCIDGGEGSDEFKYVQSLYPNVEFKPDGSRNNGLIAISISGMNQVQSWSEGDVYIDLDKEKIFNYVFFTFDVSRYKEFYEEEGDINDIPESNMEISEIDFNKIDDVINFLENEIGYTFRKGDTVYELIA